MILAIDQGTTGTTCIVFDERLQPVGRAYRELPQHFPRPGWVEHDAQEIWASVQAAAGEALADAGVRRGELQAVGITNQRETVCVWDPANGEPLHRAIVWQDRRTAARCEALRAEGHEPLVRARTGLVLDPYFSATKVEWLLQNVDGLRERAHAGRAVFGTVDAWLSYKLTGEHATDVSNAARTMLFDVAALRWDEQLLELFRVPERALPRVVASAGAVGSTDPDALHGHAAPLAALAGDQQAALFGQSCVEPGLGKNTYGTGSFVLLNTGRQPTLPAPDGLLTTVAWRIGAATDYALEASIFVTGAAVQWLRDGLGIIADARETETLAASLHSNDNVYFVPALTGLGAPHWDPHARGTIVGLTRGSTRAHLARATLEAIAYQTCDAVRAMQAGGGRAMQAGGGRAVQAGGVRAVQAGGGRVMEAGGGRAVQAGGGRAFRELRVDGGASANAWLMQFQADVLGIPVAVHEIAETTALGAAQLAAVGAGLCTISDLASLPRERARYEPSMGDNERAELLAGWTDALARARSADR